MRQEKEGFVARHSGFSAALFGLCVGGLCTMGLALAAPAARAQQEAGAPQADPRDAKPSLADTLKYVQDQVNGQGRVDVHKVEAAISDKSYTMVANAAACSMTVIEEQRPSDRSANHHVRQTGSFADFWQMIVTKHQDFVRMEIEAMERAFKNQPLLNFRNGVDIEKEENFPEAKSATYSIIIDFKDLDRADRVARAMVHAVVLCTPDTTPPVPGGFAEY